MKYSKRLMPALCLVMLGIAMLVASSYSVLAQDLTTIKNTMSKVTLQNSELPAQAEWSGKTQWISGSAVLPGTIGLNGEYNGIKRTRDLWVRYVVISNVYYCTDSSTRSYFSKLQQEKMSTQGSVPGTPNAILERDDQDSSCTITFWQSPYWICDISIKIYSIEEQTGNVQAENAIAGEMHYIVAECNRMAKQVYGRLPAAGASQSPPVAPKAPPVQSEPKPQPTLPAIPGTQETLPPVDPKTGRIPDAALPVAAGATAAVAALGALGMAAVQGLGVKDAIASVIGVLKGWTFSPPAQAPSPDSKNVFHELKHSVPDGDKGIMIAAGDVTVMSDAGSPAQIPVIDKADIPGQLDNEQALTDRSTDLPQESGEQNYAADDDSSYQQALEDLKEQRKNESTKPEQEQMEKEAKEAEKRSDDPFLLSDFQDGLKTELGKLKETVWVLDPNNSILRGIANRVFNPIDSFGWFGYDRTAWDCQQFTSQENGFVKTLAEKVFNSDVYVDTVVLSEKSSYAGEGARDWCDSQITYNHSAIRIILPNGKAYIVDFWSAHQYENFPIMQAEEKWIDMCRGLIPDRDVVFHSELHRLDRFVNPCKSCIGKHGLEKGLAEFYKDMEAKTIRDMKDGWANGVNIGKRAREAEIARLKIFIKYVRLKEGNIN